MSYAFPVGYLFYSHCDGCVTAVLGEQLFLPSSCWDKLYYPALGILFRYP